MSVFSISFLRHGLQGGCACAALALLAACGTTPQGGTGVPPPLQPEVAQPGTTPPADTPPAMGGIFGPGGIFGGPPDPGRSPEAHAAWQLEELANELGRDLHGTPVEVQFADPGVLRVAVPGHFCFDAGRSSVKQPLAAVLDRLAAQMKVKPSLQAALAGPADARDSNALLSQDRAAAARDYLIARGVPAARFAVLGQSATSGLEIRVMPRKNLRGSAEPARQVR
jgi:hypothetical protein